MGGKGGVRSRRHGARHKMARVDPGLDLSLAWAEQNSQAKLKFERSRGLPSRIKAPSRADPPPPHLHGRGVNLVEKTLKANSQKPRLNPPSWARRRLPTRHTKITKQSQDKSPPPSWARRIYVQTKKTFGCFFPKTSNKNQRAAPHLHGRYVDLYSETKQNNPNKSETIPEQIPPPSWALCRLS